MNVRQIVVSGAFDDLRSRHLRFLEEAARLGELTVLLWPDDAIRELTGQPPKLPQAERLYFLNAVRYVSRVRLVDGPVPPDALPEVADLRADVWVVGECRTNAAKEAHARARGLEYRVLGGEQLKGYPDPTHPIDAKRVGRASVLTSPDTAIRGLDGSLALPTSDRAELSSRKKVVVTGCYDWFHSGHVRFFEEVSAHGDLYVIVGHDANIRLLKGEGHPLLSQDERRYLVGSIKFVTRALISSGEGWLDADPEIRQIKPDLYAVNDDGDKGGKREYCAKLGIEYLVLTRTPAPGLPRRSSTDLRGF